jgi:hypothetical protein
MRRVATCSCAALLLAGVTWPCALLPTPVSSCLTISPLLTEVSGIFLWPDPAGFPTPGLIRRHYSVECGFEVYIVRVRYLTASVRIQPLYRSTKAISVRTQLGSPSEPKPVRRPSPVPARSSRRTEVLRISRTRSRSRSLVVACATTLSRSRTVSLTLRGVVLSFSV